VKLVAIDTETSALHPDDGGRAVVLAWAWRDRERRLRSQAIPTAFATNPEWPAFDRDYWEHVCRWLAEQQGIYHNMKFDLLHMWYVLRGMTTPHGDRLAPLHTKWVENCVWDTMLTQKVIAGENSAALKNTARRLWGDRAALEADELDDWFVANCQKTKPRYAEAPWPLVSKYARKDVKLTYRLFEWQYERLQIEGAAARRLVDRELTFARVVLAMEQRGIQFDAEAANQAAEWLLDEQDLVAKSLPFRTTRPAAKAYYFGDLPGALALTPASYTDSGAPALAERDVAELARQGQPYAREFHRHQALKAMVTKWYGPWPRLQGEDGRLRPFFNLTNVRSHRLSVQRVQLQAIPHVRHFVDMELDPGIPLPRELFGAKSGHRLWEVDLAQGEVRIAAAVTGCEAMIRIIETPGSDVHGETTKEVFGIDESDPEWKSKRDIAKRLTFGTIYAAGARKLAETVYKETGIEVSETRMRALIKRYREVFHEFFTYARAAERSVERLGYVTLISGKRRYFNFGAPLWEKAYQAFNAVIQGGLAETMRDVMILVEKELPGRLLLQIHDSLVLELPRRYEGATDKDLAEWVQNEMIGVYEAQFGVRFGAEADLWKNKK